MTGEAWNERALFRCTTSALSQAVHTVPAFGNLPANRYKEKDINKQAVSKLVNDDRVSVIGN